MSSPALLPLCLLLLGLAAPVRAEEAPTPAPEPPAAPTALAPALTRSQEQQQALMRQLPAEQQKTLQAGDESFLALLVPAARAKASGTVVLVPGDGESADWPNVIAPVRQELPTYGWQTISLSLPDPYDPVVAIERDTAPADTDAQVNSEQTAPPVTGGSGTAPAAPTQAEAGSGEPAQAAVAPVDPEAAANAQATRVLARIAAASTWHCNRAPTPSYWSATAPAPIGPRAIWRKRNRPRSSNWCSSMVVSPRGCRRGWTPPWARPICRSPTWYMHPDRPPNGARSARRKRPTRAIGRSTCR